jgi:syntaxin-binding protein 1
MLLEDLKVLELGGQGSQSIPNGLPESANFQQRPFQGYYDAKYWTKDQPPPARPAPAPTPSSRGGSENRLVPQQGSSLSSSPLPSPGLGFGVSPSVRDREKEKKKKGFLGF